MTLDEYLKSYRRPGTDKVGLSDERFGRMVDPPLSQSQVNRLRRGQSDPPRKTIEAIMKATGGAVALHDWFRPVIEKA